MNNAVKHFVQAGELRNFTAFAHGRGINTRPHTSLYMQGIQVQMGKHWHSVVWNKNFKRYTVDARLNELLQAYKNTKGTHVKTLQ